MPEGLHVLALASIPLSVLVGVLAGVWIGFRIATRDAALLARFANDAREARVMAEGADRRAVALGEEWDEAFERLESKRKSAAAAVSRREAKEEEAAEPEGEVVPLEGRERRAELQRRVNRGR